MENEPTSLIKKLISSDAVNSLVLEQKVYNKLRDNGWKTTHSPYYTDLISDKDREIDVIADQYWISSKDDKFSCRIEFLIECKSLKGYHIIATNENLRGNYLLNDHWIGTDSENYFIRLKKILLDNEVTNSNIKKIINSLQEYCLPDNTHYRHIEYYMEAFKIKAFNAFRETNINSVKEIENSVLWKCQLSLSSCIKWIENSIWEDVNFWIKTIINEPETDNKILEIINYLKNSANYLKYTHPVVVIESNLWELENEKLKELKYFRLCFQQLYKDQFWIDVVHIDSFDEYISNFKVYENLLKNKGLNLSPFYF